MDKLLPAESKTFRDVCEGIVTLSAYTVLEDKRERRVKVLHRKYDSYSEGSFGVLYSEGLMCVYEGNRVVKPKFNISYLGEFNNDGRVWIPLNLTYHPDCIYIPLAGTDSKDRYAPSDALVTSEKNIFSGFRAYAVSELFGDESLEFAGSQFPFTGKEFLSALTAYYDTNYTSLMQKLKELEAERANGQTIVDVLDEMVEANVKTYGLAGVWKDQNDVVTQAPLRSELFEAIFGKDS